MLLLVRRRSQSFHLPQVGRGKERAIFPLPMPPHDSLVADSALMWGQLTHTAINRISYPELARRGAGLTLSSVQPVKGGTNSV